MTMTATLAVIVSNAAPLVAGRTSTEWLLAACSDSKRVDRTLVVNTPTELHTIMGTHRPAYVVLLDALNPLTTVEDIDGALQLATSSELDCVVSTVELSAPIWIGEERTRGRAECETEHLVVIRGATYDATRLVSGRIGRWRVPGERVGTLSTLSDLARCEHLLRERQRTSRAESLPSRVRAIVLDFDGVFTDNQVIVTQDGVEAVSCSRSDGFGLAACRELGIPTLVLSTETNPVVSARCAKLGIDVIQGCADKAARLRTWLDETQLPADEVVYLGNDVNDLGCLELVGCSAITADAHESVRHVAKIVLEHRGGHGAVRELCMLVSDHERARRATSHT